MLWNKITIIKKRSVLKTIGCLFSVNNPFLKQLSKKKKNIN